MTSPLDAHRRARREDSGPLHARVEGLLAQLEWTQRAAAERLHDREERLRAVFEQLAVGIELVGLDGRVIEINPALASLLGREPAQVVGRYHGELTHPDDLPRERAVLSRLLSGEVANVSLEKRYLTGAGVAVWVRATSSLTRDAQGRPRYRVSVIEDVSARRASEERFRASHELSLDGFALLRPARDEQGRVVDFTFVFANQAVLRAHGRSEEQLVGRRLLELSPEDEDVVSRLAHVADTGCPSDVERPYVREGQRGWARLLAVRIGEEVAVSSADITARKRAEEALLEREEQLAAAFEAARMVGWSLDPELGTISRSANSVDVLGVAPGETEAATLARIHRDDRAAHQRAVTEAVRLGRSYRSQFRWVRPDGEVRWLEDHGRAQLDPAGRLRRLAGVLVDVTEQRRAEQELAETRVLLEAVLRQMPSGVAVVKAPSGELVLANDRVEAILGRSLDATPDRAEGGPTDEELRALTGIRPGLVCAPEERPLARAILYGDVVHGEEVRLRRADGAELVLAVSAAPVRDASGRVIAGVVTFNDITEHTRAEEALREADRRKDEFIATLAHELRNPLAPICHAAQLLRLRRPDGAQLDRLLDTIDRQAEHLTRLVDDLLDTSRITRGKLELRLEPTLLQDVLERALETTELVIAAAGHELTIELTDEPLVVEADVVRLSQVFANLLGNAAKYTPPGGRIAVRLRREGDEAVTEVSDDGIGVAPEMLPRVFEPFAQDERSRGRAQGGLGVGLTIAAGLTRMHGGAVTAASPGPGLGSTFSVRLPLSPAEPLGRGVACAPGRGDRLRLLLVDDNVDAAAMLADLLELQGHTVEVAHDGERALASALARPPDVVLLDLGLPGLDGYAVAERLRRVPATRGAVLVALTGWGHTQVRERTKAAGFDHHLVKPVEIEILRAVLASVSRPT